MTTRIYLASPYSHWCFLISWWRWFQACRAAAALMAQGYHVYSPIAHSHWLTVLGRLPQGWEFWHRVDSREIFLSNQMIVLTLKGWSKSEGIKDEIKLAKILRLEITTMSLKEINATAHPKPPKDTRWFKFYPSDWNNTVSIPISERVRRFDELAAKERS
jgi:hypothetical protein